MIEIAVIAGLFGTWVWSVLNDEEGLFSWVPRLMNRNEYTEKWLGCPWCAGAWFSAVPSLVMFHDPLAPAIFTAFAAAAITGFLGSYLEGN